MGGSSGSPHSGNGGTADGGFSGGGFSAGGFAGSMGGDTGSAGCDSTCSGCSPIELEVHCSFGTVVLSGEVEEPCADAESAFTGEGGAGGKDGVDFGGAGGSGGVSSNYCDDYVERGEVELGCDFGCRAIDRWEMVGTCTINGECCVLETYLFCG